MARRRFCAQPGSIFSFSLPPFSLVPPRMCCKSNGGLGFFLSGTHCLNAKGLHNTLVLPIPFRGCLGASVGLALCKPDGFIPLLFCGRVSLSCMLGGLGPSSSKIRRVWIEAWFL